MQWKERNKSNFEVKHKIELNKLLTTSEREGKREEEMAGEENLHNNFPINIQK